MEKTVIYDALKADGAKLRPVNFYSAEQLDDIYLERFGFRFGGADPVPANPSVSEERVSANELCDTADEIRTLYFAFGGWCEELSTSFAPGYRKCRSKEEYQALKKYAAKVL